MSLSLRFPLILIIVSTFFPAISQERSPMETNEDFHRAMEELSNWGRWGEDDELGQANFHHSAETSRCGSISD